MTVPPSPSKRRISVVTPTFNEGSNLPAMHQRLDATLEQAGSSWEWLIVDDASTDDTYAVAAGIAAKDPHVRVIRLSRNFGSHIALICGLDHARGDCAVGMAADLQDPPEAIPALLAQWSSGSQVVWAVRDQREGEARGVIAFSRLYYWLIRKVAGLKDTPITGADFVLLDRRVIDAVRRFPEHNASFFALVTWMGFRQTSIRYDKRARQQGRSGWTLRKKVKLVVDSLTSFSYLPIRWMSCIGLAVSALGLLYALVVVLNAFFGKPVEGWTSIMVAVLFLGGGQMFMLGVLGEYIWRGLDESRRRPRYLIESTAGQVTAEQRSSTSAEEEVHGTVVGDP